ncbi:EPIDERMAL PATTERNING FACTOR-like protein 3 [Morella rubra]|uniref:Epidermal patterning factor-like protein n=1 Tax=Morella rubra TaxID=262757 RepID=A0A6A1W6K1_9ROSI|nr:EPIDERMAL PATTERNING FACTOR-like protein 3 [Morella rubra]
MKRRFCCFIIALQIVCWASATSRPFPPNDRLGDRQPGRDRSPDSLTVTLGTGSEGFKSVEGKMNKEAIIAEGKSKIGSSPPSCEHKCYGCVPCDAIQVPTTGRHSNVGIQYANYEPEGWKCKCGPSIYSP